MKMAGKPVNSPPRDVIIFPRATGHLIFHVKGVASLEEFDTISPRPVAPKIMRRGITSANLDDPGYKQQLQAWADARQNWLILQALDCPENELTWEQVKLDDRSTWNLLESELRSAGLSDIEVQRLIAKVYEVNALSDRAMEAARNDFLLTTSLVNELQGSPAAEPNSI